MEQSGRSIFHNDVCNQHIPHATGYVIYFDIFGLANQARTKVVKTSWYQKSSEGFLRCEEHKTHTYDSYTKEAE